MNNELVQKPVTDVTENTDAQAVEENEEGILLTDTTSQNEEKKDVKSYTDEELEKIVNDKVNEILPNKIERERRKMEKEYRKKLSDYEETQSIFSAGLGTSDMAEANKKMREFYRGQGIEIPTYQKNRYSDDDEKALGELDAEKIIKFGYDDMQEEANRLAQIGKDKMTVRERATFMKLADELTRQNQLKELAEIGVSGDIVNNDDFKKFASQFNKNTPIKNVYEMYQLKNPKQKREMMGSMKNTKSDNVEKDYYSPEDVMKLSPSDWKKPGVWEKVRASQKTWK